MEWEQEEEDKRVAALPDGELETRKMWRQLRKLQSKRHPGGALRRT
jgi:hypothetical protein